MGSYLDKPVTKKDSECGSNDIAIWGASSMQGWRTGMEDTHIIHQVSLGDGEEGMIFGVFDGHGGDQVAKMAKSKFKDILIELDEFKEGEY